MLTLAVTALALSTLAGCGDSTPTVKQSKVEDTISGKLEEQVGQAPDDVSCPGDLEGKVGTTMRCQLTAGSDELGVSVKVTSVKDSKVNFSFEVDQMDQGGSGS